MAGPHIERAGPDPARAAAGLVMLHGRGGSAADILGLLAHAGLPDVAAVAPEAPGNSWWPVSFLSPSATLEPFVAAGVAAAMAAVAELEAAGLPRDRIWLLGFSQGAGLALETFAREGTGLAGVFGMSGGLIGTADADGPATDALYGYRPKRFDYAGPRTGRAWLSCHERDPHIPLARVQETASVLRALGADVQIQLYHGAGHSVMREDIAAMRARLNG